ncbi:MAG TPA: FAD-dependent oxidoreductase [Burkholderiales bacterium]|nr:FAD-dependent oxidoreductase [Burkholderiales bacterium]
MQSDAGVSPSVWSASAQIPDRPPLRQDASAEICIVGGGIAGLSAAYYLAREGKSLVLVDDGPLGGGATSRTTAHLTNAFDDRYYQVARLHGADVARLVAQSHTAAIDAIDNIVREERIDCDFERLPGYLFMSPGGDADELHRELEAVRDAGIKAVEFVPRLPLSFSDFGPALCFPRQGQFHPLRYIAGLAAAVERYGGKIYTHTHARRIEGGERAHVETDDGFVIAADAVIVATNTPVNDQVTMHTKQAPYRTYVVGARLPVGAVPSMLLWDTLHPYHYVRVQRNIDGRDVLIVGGEDHKTGQADDFDRRYAHLQEWTRTRFPMIEGFDYHWSGQVMEPVDYLGFIGRNPGHEENVYIVTGDSGNGMTHGTIAGLLLRDLLLRRENPWASVYDPARISFGAAGDFARENLNVAVQFADYATAGELQSIDDVLPGQGAVIRNGWKKIAVYRDDSGVPHCHSAVCTHLRCIVHWNSAEQSWDCPCHGSRFDKFDGHPINGPALHGLAPIEDLRES